MTLLDVYIWNIHYLNAKIDINNNVKMKLQKSHTFQSNYMYLKKFTIHGENHASLKTKNII